MVTGYTPFEINLGRYPNSGAWPLTGLKGASIEGRKVAKKVLEVQAQWKAELAKMRKRDAKLCRNLQKANKAASKSYNRRYKPIEFQIG